MPGLIGIQSDLNLLTNIIVMILLLFFRQSQRKIDDKIDAQLTSPADYTIMVRNIPKRLKIDYEQELKKLFAYHAVPDTVLHPTSVTLI